MKSIIRLFLVLGSIYSAPAQFDENNAIYLSTELNLGNYIGVDLNLNYIYANRVSFKLGYTGNIRKPKTQPDDYKLGLTSLFSFGLANPFDQFESYQIGLGKIYNLNQSGTIRVNLSIGIGYSIIKEPENWQLVEDAFFVENYTWNYKRINTVSFVINPKFEFPFTRFYGVTLSPMVQINKKRLYIGIGIGNMIGLLRKSKD